MGLKSFSIVGRRYSAGSSRRFSPFFSDRFERRGLVYVGASIHHKTASDAVFAEYGFTWDAGNNITEFETVDGTVDYTSDKTGQLTGADYDYITDELYTYDDNGNRTNAGYVTGENNETLSDGVYRYSYDNEGNRTEKFLWTDFNNDGIIDASEKTLVQSYEWDYRNRLSSVTNYENGIAKEVIDYLYDYLNLMIERTVTDAATSALQSSDFNIYSNGQIVLEYDTTSSVDVVKSVNLWGANIDELAAVEQIAQSVNDKNIILWTYGDHLNSIRDVVLYDSIAQTATVVNHLIYNAFGILVSSTDGAANPASISPLLNYRYTGKYFDDSTGLQNNINRWYDNTIGKWLSVDPIGFNGGDSNLYRYVLGKPITINDATGLILECKTHESKSGKLFSRNLDVQKLIDDLLYRNLSIKYQRDFSSKLSKIFSVFNSLTSDTVQIINHFLGSKNIRNDYQGRVSETRPKIHCHFKDGKLSEIIPEYHVAANVSGNTTYSYNGTIAYVGIIPVNLDVDAKLGLKFNLAFDYVSNTLFKNSEHGIKNIHYEGNTAVDIEVTLSTGNNVNTPLFDAGFSAKVSGVYHSNMEIFNNNTHSLSINIGEQTISFSYITKAYAGIKTLTGNRYEIVNYQREGELFSITIPGFSINTLTQQIIGLISQ